MKPLKSITPLAMWLMRIAVLLFVYQAFFESINTLNFKVLEFYISAAFTVFSLLLFVGGFLKTSSLTVLSALCLFILSVYKIVDISSAGLGLTLAMFGLFATISLFFIAAGNKT